MGVKTGLAAVARGRKRIAAAVVGMAMVASIATAVPASAVGVAAAPKVTITTSSIVKATTSCAYRSWNVKISGLPSGGSWTLKSTLVKGKNTITGTPVGPVKNGANKFKAYICSSLDAVGTYKATAGLRKGSKLVSSAATKVKLRVKPAIDFGYAGGVPGTSSAYVTGYIGSSNDAKGATVQVFFKKNGASKYTLLGTTKAQAYGQFKFTSAKLTAGQVYYQHPGSNYLLKSKSAVTKLTVTSGSAGAFGG